MDQELTDYASDMVATLKLERPMAVGHAGIFFKIADDYWRPQASILYPGHRTPVLNRMLYLSSPRGALCTPDLASQGALHSAVVKVVYLHMSLVLSTLNQ